MEIKENENQKKPLSRKKTNNSFYIVAIVVVIILVFLFFLWQQKKFDLFTADQGSNNRIVSKNISIPEPPPPNKTISEQPSTGYSSTTPNLSDNAQTQVNTIPTVPQSNDSNTDVDSSTGGVDNASQPGLASNTTTKEPGVLAKKCLDSTEVIKKFYNHLDLQEYMKSYSLAQSSEEHFTQLIQKLLDNPPVVSGETDDLFTILQNTAHFFRVIGKDNILILKGILDREKGQFENVLYNFYSIFNTPSCPANSFNLTVSETSLYDYAGFFLNTMGGRLYLFRRDSMSRMVVSYYSILLIDQANKEARNKHGIEIMTVIDQLITEMEANSKQLKFEQLYLDNLYTLKELYQ